MVPNLHDGDYNALKISPKICKIAIQVCFINYIISKTHIDTYNFEFVTRGVAYQTGTPMFILGLCCSV